MGTKKGEGIQQKRLWLIYLTSKHGWILIFIPFLLNCKLALSYFIFTQERKVISKFKSKNNQATTKKKNQAEAIVNTPRQTRNMFKFAIDRGGTFTDIYAEISRPNASKNEFRVMKLLSNDPDNYSDAPREGIRRFLFLFCFYKQKKFYWIVSWIFFVGNTNLAYHFMKIQSFLFLSFRIMEECTGVSYPVDEPINTSQIEWVILIPFSYQLSNQNFLFTPLIQLIWTKKW